MRLSVVRVVLGAALFVACEQKPIAHREPHAVAPPVPTGVAVDSAKVDLFGALPDAAKAPDVPSSEEAVALGKMLYFDERLSEKRRKVSCNGCHDLAHAGVDGKDFSDGPKGVRLERNTPTVLNAALAFAQFYDGRADTLEAAIRATLLDPAMMAQPSEGAVVDALKGVPGYADAFAKAFPGDPSAVTFDHAVKALGAFCRTLLSPSAWDRFAKGERAALSDDEKKGFLEFVSVGCPTCHVGPLVGGTMYQKLGKEKPWPNQKDHGRSRVTRSPSDDMMFKVPSLRNVERTAPYFHDASESSLDAAVKSMASHQLGKDISDADAHSIATFLRALTGSPRADLLQPPALPPDAAGGAKAPPR